MSYNALRDMWLVASLNTFEEVTGRLVARLEEEGNTPYTELALALLETPAQVLHSACNPAAHRDIYFANGGRLSRQDLFQPLAMNIVQRISFAGDLPFYYLRKHREIAVLYYRESWEDDGCTLWLEQYDDIPRPVIVQVPERIPASGPEQVLDCINWHKRYREEANASMREDPFFDEDDLLSGPDREDALLANYAKNLRRELGLC